MLDGFETFRRITEEHFKEHVHFIFINVQTQIRFKNLAHHRIVPMMIDTERISYFSQSFPLIDLKLFKINMRNEAKTVKLLYHIIYSDSELKSMPLRSSILILWVNYSN